MTKGSQTGKWETGGTRDPIDVTDVTCASWNNARNSIGNPHINAQGSLHPFPAIT